MEYPESTPIRFERYGSLIATGKSMPETVVTNQEIIDKYKLIASDRAVQYSIGISERRQTQEGESVVKYLCQAAQKCLRNAGVDISQVSRIIYSKLTGDQYIPSNSSKVLNQLEQTYGIPVMDISAACSGFAHAMEIALSFINGGEDYVLVLSGDKASASSCEWLVPDTRTIFLNGDGFAAALFGHSEQKKFLSHYFYTDSSIQDFAYIPYGTSVLNNETPIAPENFMLTMPDGPKIHQSVLSSCQIIAKELLKQTSLTIDDIDYFITSDQTTMVWKAQLAELNIPEEKSISCFHKYGNTVAAMVPLNLNEAIETGKLQRGMKVMLMAHGAGASGGGFIFEF